MFDDHASGEMRNMHPCMFYYFWVSAYLVYEEEPGVNSNPSLEWTVERDQS